MDIRANTLYAPPPATADEVSPRQILRVLSARKWLLLSISLLTLLCAVAAYVVLPNKYVASVLLSPQSDSLSSSALGPIGQSLSQFGSLASLAGFNVPRDIRRAEAVAMLQSRILTEKYIRDNDLLPVLFASQWDAKAKRWKVSSRSETPTLWMAARKFSGIRKVKTDTSTGLVTLTIRWTDPVTAARWANGLVQLTNDYLRNEAITLAERDIAFLNDQAARTNIVETKQAIAQLLQSELNKVMLAKGSEEYAFKVLDPAQPPQRPSDRRLILLAFGTICVIFASMIIVLFTTDPTSV